MRYDMKSSAVDLTKTLKCAMLSAISGQIGHTDSQVYRSCLRRRLEVGVRLRPVLSSL